MELINNFKFGCIVFFLLFFSTQVAPTQQSPVWDKPALRDSVIALLLKYQELHNKLNNQTAPEGIRDFIHVFSNSKVQVANEIGVHGQQPQISIEEYAEVLPELFPEGLAISYDLVRLKMDMPRYDRNNRYLARIRTSRSLYGISGGRIFESTRRIIFQIGFYYDNNSPGDFRIYGISLLSGGQSQISASFSPALTEFVNSTLGSDERLGQKAGTGYTGALFYSFYFSDHWGAGAGAQFSQYSGRISLNEFDTFGGFDPNFKDIIIDNDLWFAEVPAFLSYRSNLSTKWRLVGDIGVFMGVRLFERANSSALSTNLGATMTNVFSDPEWVSMMTRVNMGLQGSITINHSINHQLGLFVGGGIRQGLSGLDNNEKPGFISSKYLGQYNPLWGAPGRTVNRAFFVKLGATFFIPREDER